METKPSMIIITILHMHLYRKALLLIITLFTVEKNKIDRHK